MLQSRSSYLFVALTLCISGTSIAHSGHRVTLGHGLKHMAHSQASGSSGYAIAVELKINLDWKKCKQKLTHSTTYSICAFEMPAVDSVIAHLDEERYTLEFKGTDSTVALSTQNSSMLSLTWYGPSDKDQATRESLMMNALAFWKKNNVVAGSRYYRHTATKSEYEALSGTVLKKFGDLVSEVSLGKAIAVMRRLNIDFDTCKKSYETSQASCFVAALPSWRIDHPGDPGGGDPICQKVEIRKGSIVTLCVDAFESSYQVSHSNKLLPAADILADFEDAIISWTQNGTYIIPYSVMTTKSETRTPRETFLIKDDYLGEPMFEYREISRLDKSACKDSFVTTTRFCDVKLGDLPKYVFQHIASEDKSFYRVTEEAVYGVDFLSELDEYRIHFQNKDRTPTELADLEMVIEEFGNSAESISAYRITQAE